MQLNFAFGSIEEEALSKAKSLVTVWDESRDELLEQCEAYFSPENFRRVQETLGLLEDLEPRDAKHPSIQAYLSHPVRVASGILRMLPAPCLDCVLASLLHNVYEIGGLNEDTLLGQGYGRFVADGIRLLTIDRRLQNDPDYLRGFYEAIEAFGVELALIRCIDKMDNLLAHYAIKATPERTLYLVVTQRHVVPVATRLDQRLGDYMSDVIVHMAGFGAQTEWVSRYDAFKSRTYDH